MAYYPDNNHSAPINRRQNPPFPKGDGNHRHQRNSSYSNSLPKSSGSHHRTSSSLASYEYRDSSSSSSSSALPLTNFDKHYGQPSLKRPRMDQSHNSDGDDNHSNPTNNYTNSQPKNYHTYNKNGQNNGYSNKPYQSRRNRHYSASGTPNNGNSRSHYPSKGSNVSSNNGNSNNYNLGNEKSFSAIFTSIARQRIFSDFRIARVKIGKMDIVEDCTLDPPIPGVKDSRLRLYFKGSANDTAKYINNNNNYNNTPNQNSFDRAIAEPDRLSISLFHGTKRIVIPVQDGLDKVQFRRKDGYFRIKSHGWALFEEIDSRRNYNNPNSNRILFKRCDDITKGQLEAADGLIEVWTDLRHPLPIEPKWTKGNLCDYIDSRSKYLTHNVLQVLDPEHVIDFDSLVELWVRDSVINSQTERLNFAKSQLCKLPVLLELCSKILAPPYYYVSKALAATSNNPHPTASNSNYPSSENGTPPAPLNPHTVASILDSSQIPALISTSVNTLLATAVFFSEFEEPTKSKSELERLIKKVMFQVPEPILWRSLDGLFGKIHNNSNGFNFDYKKILKSSEEKTLQKQKEIDSAKQVAQELEKIGLLQDPESSINTVQSMQDNSNKNNRNLANGSKRNTSLDSRNRNRSQSWNTNAANNGNSTALDIQQLQSSKRPSTPITDFSPTPESNSANSATTTNVSTAPTSNPTSSTNDSGSGNSTNCEENSESNSSNEEAKSEGSKNKVTEKKDPDSALSQSNVKKVDSTLKTFRKLQKEEEENEKEIEREEEEDDGSMEDEEEEEDENDEDYNEGPKPKEQQNKPKTSKLMKDLNPKSKNNERFTKSDSMSTTDINTSICRNTKSSKTPNGTSNNSHKGQLKKRSKMGNKKRQNINNDQSDMSSINTDQSDMSGDNNGGGSPRSTLSSGSSGNLSSTGSMMNLDSNSD